MKKYLVAFAVILSCNISISQDFKFGKVSKAELSEKVHPLDSSANAAVLYKKETINFYYTDYDGFMQEREIHERIKIYNKEGYDYATERIYLYQGGSAKNETTSNIKGYTYNLENNKIQKEKLKKGGIFEEDYNEFTKLTTLTMPNIQDGAVVEFSYKIISPFLAIDDIVFQYDIPINKLDVRVATPQYYRYNKSFNTKAFYTPKVIEKTVDKSAKYSQRNTGTIGRSDSGGYNSGTFEYKDNVVKLNETNIPALKEEAYAGSMSNYRTKMSMELSEIVDKYGVVEKSFSTSWSKVSKSIYDSPNFGNQLKRNGFFEDDISGLLTDATNAFQKAFIVQSFVKSKVKWNGINSYTAISGTKDAYKEGSGSTGDINLLLIAMLKSVGVNANPVLVSTKNNGIPIFPTRRGFNYVICMVEEGDSYALLDASDLYSSINVLPEKALNWQGRLIRDDGTSTWVSLIPNKQAVESTALNVTINDDLTINGKVRQNLTANSALDYRKKYIQLSEDDHVKMLEKNKGDIEISELTITNKTDITKPLSVSYDYLLSDAIDDLGDKLYFSPLLFLKMDESPFKLENRQYPVDFGYPFKEKELINIMLPDGFSVESLPENSIFQTDNGAVKFTFVVKQNNNTIQVVSQIDINQSIIDSNEYSALKQFFETIVEKQSEKIVLKKV